MTPFRVVLADPPWKFHDRLPGRGRGAAKHYRVLSTQEICTFMLPTLADDCVLFLWRVAAMQREALDVMTAWGFTLKSELVWLKRTRHGKRWFGMGRIVRAEHEVCLIGTRGRPTPRTHGARSTFEAIAAEHSAKPDAFYDIVEQLYSGPYVELFARHRQPGWTSVGDELASADLSAKAGAAMIRPHASTGLRDRLAPESTSLPLRPGPIPSRERGPGGPNGV